MVMSVNPMSKFLRLQKFLLKKFGVHVTPLFGTNEITLASFACAYLFGVLFMLWYSL